MRAEAVAQLSGIEMDAASVALVEDQIQGFVFDGTVVGEAYADRLSAEKADANATLEGTSVTDAEADAPVRTALYDKVLGSRFGKRATATISGLTLVGGAAAVEAPSATASVAIPNTVTMTVKNAHIKASDVATKKVVIGEDMRIKIDKKTENDCIETKKGQVWGNSVRLANGKTLRYPESVPAKLCKDKYSTTGWVKRGGGKTGLDCRNEAIPPGHKMPKAKYDVINVKSLGMHFTLHAIAKAKASADCGTSKASGSATAEVKQTFTYREFLRLKGSGMTKVSLTLNDRATAKAEAAASCESITITTTTPEQPPVKCTDTKTAEQCAPKPGNPGEGTGTTTTNNGGSSVGGPGAGGQPGNTETGRAACYDDNSASNGDLNPATPVNPNQPATLYGTPDQLGYCNGPATATVNG